MILALEATDRGGSVALADQGQLLSLEYLHSTKTHSQRLMPTAQRLLDQHGYEFSDVDHLACASGPGSFTAVRLAVTTAKTLALAGDSRLSSVSSLGLLAHLALPNQSPVRVLLDARRGEFYHQRFQAREDQPEPTQEPELIDPESLNQSVSDETETVVVRERDQQLDPDQWPESWRWINSARTQPLALPLIELVQNEASVAEPSEPDRVQPLYVRDSDAEKQTDGD